jgi:ATP-dependent RNA helicase HelY
MMNATPRRVTRAQLLEGYRFELDRFQLDALDALDAGESVLVAAPTGSGKTVVAEYAVAKALAEGRRAFYTAPIKALSNQKFLDLVAMHGAEQVGLLTGDNAINGDAPIVVMTTEVLRNMIYARSGALSQLACVVLDEVHFLQDTYRGPVWEEVIIHLPYDVRLVCLSATVSNAEELVDWMRTVRGPTSVVEETKRPVALEHLHLIGDRSSDRLHLMPVFVDGRPNPEAERLDGEHARGPRSQAHKGRHHRKLFTPDRVETVELLDDLHLLPVLYFIFSRNQCDEAASRCLDAGLRLTSGTERHRIREIASARLSVLSESDLDVLGYQRFITALENGIASHHAGMVPPFREAVERCFSEGLVKVVFATETLAVGVNMPARTTVIEKLTKYNGERHEFLTPSSFTQLTGRAGRRGIDVAGTAVTMWNQFVTFEQVAGLVGSRSFALTSAFRPTYNMSANLVRSAEPERARQLLNLSFAQFQSDGDIVRLEARLERRTKQLAELREQAVSPFGDIEDYRLLIDAVVALPPSRASVNEVERALERIRPGDVIWMERGRNRGRVCVLTVAGRQGGIKLKVITPNRILAPMSAPDFSVPPVVLARLELPEPFAPTRQSFQRQVAGSLLRLRVQSIADLEALDDADAGRPPHPVEADPHLADRLKAASSADRLEREVVELRSKVRGRTDSLARRFDRILELLGAWGYTDDWALTDAGQRLARLFHECDLLIVESLRRKLFDGLSAPELAGMVSVFVYEHRSPEPPPPPWFPSKECRRKWNRISELADMLEQEELERRLTVTRKPDPTFVAAAWAWAAGESFSDVIGEEELTGGDFVRNIKQLIDLLRQLGDVAPSEATRRTARQAAGALLRGVVAASSTVGDMEAPVVESVDDRALGSDVQTMSDSPAEASQFGLADVTPHHIRPSQLPVEAFEFDDSGRSSDQ